MIMGVGEKSRLLPLIPNKNFNKRGAKRTPMKLLKTALNREADRSPPAIYVNIAQDAIVVGRQARMYVPVMNSGGNSESVNNVWTMIYASSGASRKQQIWMVAVTRYFFAAASNISRFKVMPFMRKMIMTASLLMIFA